MPVFVSVYDFNPRPREEGDYRFPTRGTIPQHFNPRPREEGDNVLKVCRICGCNFNPRPREEGDLYVLS